MIRKFNSKRSFHLLGVGLRKGIPISYLILGD
jgi:hypothetical protein